MTEIEESFERFWAIYPRKVSKGAAEKVWQKMFKGYNVSDLKVLELKITSAVDAQIRYRRNHNDDFIPDWKHPSTWLNGKCWLDIISDQAEKSKVVLPRCRECDDEVMGPQFKTCQKHYSLVNGKLTHSYADEMREYFKRHPEVQSLRGKAAIEWIKEKIKGMVI